MHSGKHNDCAIREGLPPLHENASARAKPRTRQGSEWKNVRKRLLLSCVLIIPVCATAGALWVLGHRGPGYDR